MSNDGTGIRSFHYGAADAELADPLDRLDRTRWSDAIPGTQWTLGVDPDYAQDLLAFWRDEYDWRATGAWLNAFPQFMTTIDGLDIHFLHIRTGANATVTDPRLA